MTRWPRRTASLITAGLLATGLLIWGAQSSLAVHDTGQFELDGNIVHDGTAAYDWGNLFDASGNQAVTPDPNNGPVLASEFVDDKATPDKSYFAESDKDGDPIASWDCKTVNNPTDKDDLLHAYAALVQVPNDAPDNAGHKVLYLGSERDSNNGDSFAGFWLLKDPGAGCTGNNGFSGGHTDGDILVVSNYTNGGGKQDVQVYMWVGDDATGHAELQASFNGSVCSNSLTNDNACAIANGAPISAPWASGNLPTNTFVEAGIDMTALLGKSGGCFTTFLAESRSSQELTAQLKDFAAGQFNTCPAPPIHTTATPGGDTAAPGSAQSDVATVDEVGNRGTPTGTVNFFLCGPTEVDADTCPAGTGTQVGGAVALDNGSATSDTIDGSTTPDDNTAGEYCWRAEYTPDADSEGNYLPSIETDFANECFTVVLPPSTASSSPSLSTSASSSVTTPPPSLSFSPTSAGPVANTGAGPITDEVSWAIALLVLGGGLAVAGKRRGYRRMH
jgi:hypothetical protein